MLRSRAARGECGSYRTGCNARAAAGAVLNVTRYVARVRKSRACTAPSQLAQVAAVPPASGDGQERPGRATLLWPGIGAPATAASWLWSAAAAEADDPGRAELAPLGPETLVPET